MTTKLSRYAEGLMEAAWLAALVVVPVFFNTYSSRIFEPDKLALLRTLALVALGAWVVKLVDEGSPRWERLRPEGTFLWRMLQLPLIAPVLALAAVLLVSSLFSVARQFSFWGSYQRLQGAYTTFSYIIIFAAMLGNLRRRAQVERLITTVIIASLPVSLYGVLQRYQIDPVPWGGNVARRIAANMGNAIFVAAYLIMASPLTLGRIVDSFGAILQEREGLGAHFVRSTVYVFTGALQLIALYLSQSRGPMLGWLAGAFFLFVLLSLQWRKRWMTLGIVGTAIAAAGFLVLLNIPGGPLESLRGAQGIGRLGRVFETEGGTGRVRVLIWQGASRLVAPHEPLVYPDGQEDPFNFIRPLIGYGPESMHVAFNRFFPPELAQLERRNASPDRSHNETWDALVTTGFLGLVVYLFLFASVFYYGLKWLGLLQTRGDRNLFLGLYVGGGLVGAVGMTLWQGVEFFGVGLPVGIVIGVILYLTLLAVGGRYVPPESAGGRARALTLTMLLSAIVAHFVEIHFGIAIAATRTYFWTFAAALLVVGYILPLHGGYGEVVADKLEQARPEAGREKNRRRKGGRRRRGGGRTTALGLGDLRTALIGGAVIGILLATLGYDFINVQSNPGSALAAVWESFTRLPNRGGAVSYGVLTMVVTVWFAACLVFSAEDQGDEGLDLGQLAVTLGFSGFLALVFWLWHAGWLVAGASAGAVQQVPLLQQAVMIEGLLARYYVYLLFIVFTLAVLLPVDWPVRATRSQVTGWLVAPLVLVVVLALSVTTNLRVIQADISYKLADPFAKSGQFEPAILLYRRANELAPAEDFYKLFLGKSYLESSQALQGGAQQEQRVQEAERILKRAQALNPLNTDHTANLARLYRWWTALAEDADTRLERARLSDRYYERALALSPNNVGLWGEWASLHLTALNQPDEAFERLAHALELDDTYETNQALMGDYYAQSSRGIEDETARREALENAARHYRLAIEHAPNKSISNKYNYRIALAGVYIELGQFEDAIRMYESAAAEAPQRAELWRVYETIASLYVEIGDLESALVQARNALALAPEEEKSRLETLVSQLQSDI